MKSATMVIFQIAILTLLGCKSPLPEAGFVMDQSKIEVQTDTIRKTINDQSTKKINPNRLNYTDENGLKQGRWEERGWSDVVIAIKTFVNDTLNGPWHGSNGIFINGVYRNGKKEGFERHYYKNDSDSNTIALGYYENGEALWFAHPAADFGLLFPHKGMNVQIDSCYLKVPFRDSTLWYEGLYLDKEAVGVHKVYYPSGNLHGLVDYEKEWVLECDQEGKVLLDSSFQYYFRTSRFGTTEKLLNE